MEYRPLGKSDIQVSTLCLGSMTWGEQNTESEAHQQINMAWDAGVNFIDTAELYPVPPNAKTYGQTESIIGHWLQQNKDKRNQMILASKVTGPSDMVYMRGENTSLNRKQIESALEASLKRLKTDRIDLYQLHWPERSTNYFGKLGYAHSENIGTPLEETLETLADIAKTGKVRYFGLSNETPWGAMQCLQLAKNNGWPRMVSIQNPYNLLNRTFEVGLAEIAHREQMGLLAYSPLAFGALSGKYLHGARPEGARLTVFARFSRYLGAQADRAIEAYVALAEQHDLDPSQMALSYVTSRSFVTSNIIGATSLEQLESNLKSAELKLSDEVMQGIEAIHLQNSNPCP